MICGAIINEKNFGVNSIVFNEKNKIDNIINCPFCGVGQDFLSESMEVLSTDSKLLDENTLKILDHAVKLEIFNGDFYIKAAKKADNKKTKELFMALSTVEMIHAKIHSKIGGFNNMPILTDVTYDKYKDDKALLDLANTKEKHAVSFYEKYKTEVEDKVIIKIFEAVCDVERQHIILTIV